MVEIICPQFYKAKDPKDRQKALNYLNASCFLKRQGTLQHFNHRYEMLLAVAKLNEAKGVEHKPDAKIKYQLISKDGCYVKITKIEYDFFLAMGFDFTEHCRKPEPLTIEEAIQFTPEKMITYHHDIDMLIADQRIPFRDRVDLNIKFQNAKKGVS
jgi:hypothetical protein